MEPISNVNRIALLIRQRLEERARANRGSKRNAAAGKERQSADPMLRAAEIAGIEGAEDSQVRRLFIQAILADRLGSGLVNEVQFQQLVVRVTDAIDADPSAAKLLTRAIRDLQSTS